MNDQCMNCTVRGDLDACIKTPCSQHKSWYAQTLTAKIKEVLAQPEQEPVAWMCHPFGDDECEFSDHQECENCIPLYTTPPQRTWVGLTDEELRQIWYDDEPVEGGTYVDKLRQVEAKLKEKNNA